MAAKTRQIAVPAAQNFRGHFVSVPSLFPRKLPSAARLLSCKWHLNVPSEHPNRIVAGGDHTMRIRAILIYLCIASLAGGLASAAPAGQIRVQVNLVNLFATVRDKHKAIVTGLKQDDFQVYEDGQPQEITYFSAESNLPITLGILMDTSGSEYYMLSGEKEAG